MSTAEWQNIAGFKKIFTQGGHKGIWRAESFNYKKKAFIIRDVFWGKF